MGLLKESESRPRPEAAPYIYLFLDVEEILEKFQNKNDLSKKDKTIIKSAYRLLKKAEKGEKMVSKTTGWLRADMDLIKPLDIISGALGGFRGLKEILRTSTTVLQDVVKGSSISKISPENFQETREFFEILSDYSFKQYQSSPAR